MVTFVPGFVSRQVAEYGSEMQRVNAELRQRFAGDDAARRRELDAWRESHPTPKATLKDVADHIDHIRKVAGVDHIGIGSDFYTAANQESMAKGLEDVSRYPYLFAELLRRGYSDEDALKIAGRNHLRAMRQMEKTAAQLQKSEPPLITEGVAK